MNKKTISIYTTQTCAKCKPLKQWLTSKGFIYKEHDLTDDNTLQQKIIEATSSMTVPVVEIDGQYVVGPQYGRILELLA